MIKIKKFESIVNRLTKIRTNPIRQTIKLRKVKRRRLLSRQKRDFYIKKLQELATLIILRKLKDKKRLYKPYPFKLRKKGDKRIELVMRKIRRELPCERYFVYAFIKKKQYLKVGQSTRGLKRIEDQRDAYYFRDADRMKIFLPIKGKTKNLSRLECIITHQYKPKLRRHKPPNKKHKVKCEICKAHNIIKKEIGRMF